MSTAVYRYLNLYKDLKFYRKQLGLTQQQLAKRVGCAQSMIVKIEKENLVPDLYQKAFNEVFDFQDVEFRDALNFGGNRGVQAWMDWVESFAYFHEAEGRSINALLESDGLTAIFDYFLKRNVEMPTPIIPNDMHALMRAWLDDPDPTLDDNFPCEAPRFEIEAWDGFWNLASEFDLNLWNFLNNLDDIYSNNQITFESYLKIRENGIGFVWNQLISDWGDDNLLKVLNYDHNYCQNYKNEFSREVADAWLYVWRSASRADSHLVMPTWDIGALLDAAENDWTSILNNDVTRDLMAGLSPDPFVRKLQTEVQQLNDKLDLLLQNFFILKK